MITVRLKEIYAASFGRSEMTNYRRWQKETGRSLAKGEALCLVALSGNQMVFVWKPTKVVISSKTQEAFLSVRVRLDHKHWWEPKMLQNYAAIVGLELIGLKRYEDFYKSDE